MAITISQTMNNKLTRVDIGSATVWFSYVTMVAYKLPGDSENRVVCENVWGTTTGISRLSANPTNKGIEMVEDIYVIGIDTDGSAICLDLVSGEKWNSGEHFLEVS